MIYIHKGLAYRLEYRWYPPAEEGDAESFTLDSIWRGGKDVTAQIDEPTQWRMVNACLAHARATEGGLCLPLGSVVPPPTAAPPKSESNGIFPSTTRCKITSGFTPIRSAVY